MANISCPYNTFCVGNASESCNDTAMYECADCNYSGFIALLCIAFILGVFIVMGNALIIAIFVQRWRKSSDMKTDAIKLSLAVADLVTGEFCFYFICGLNVGPRFFFQGARNRKKARLGILLI